jgi:Protein of unknown function (DUF3019)
MKPQILSLVLAVLPGLAAAADLHLTPSVCAVDDSENRCSISVSVDFDADDERHYCLSVDSKGMIRCFHGGIRDLEVYISSDRDIRFQVSNTTSGQDVAAATLKVAHYQPKRHRRRYGWGLL